MDKPKLKKIQTLKTNKFENKRAIYDENQKHYDSKWRKFSSSYRKNNPWCCECKKNGIWNDKDIEVDHIKPLEVHPELKYDLNNLQSLCKSHHSAKTYGEKLSRKNNAEKIQDDINLIRKRMK
jgi:5-methylcytosine-specific restriction protein A